MKLTFYIYNPDYEKYFLFEWIQKAYNLYKGKILLVANEEELLKSIDLNLWILGRRSFLPHCRLSDDSLSDDDKMFTPIWLSTCELLQRLELKIHFKACLSVNIDNIHHQYLLNIKTDLLAIACNKEKLMYSNNDKILNIDDFRSITKDITVFEMNNDGKWLKV